MHQRIISPITPDYSFYKTFKNKKKAFLSLRSTNADRQAPTSTATMARPDDDETRHRLQSMSPEKNPHRRENRGQSSTVGTPRSQPPPPPLRAVNGQSFHLEPRSVANVAILVTVVIPSLPSASVFGRRRGFRRRETPSPLGRAIVEPVGGWRLRACPRRWSGRNARRLLTRLSAVGRDGVGLPGPLSDRPACGLGRRLGLDARRME